MAKAGMIVKVQTPLATNRSDAADLVLVYDKNRKFQFEGPSPDLAGMMRKLGVNRAYFRASVTPERKFLIGDRVFGERW